MQPLVLLSLWIAKRRGKGLSGTQYHHPWITCDRGTMWVKWKSSILTMFLTPPWMDKVFMGFKLVKKFFPLSELSETFLVSMISDQGGGR